MRPRILAILARSGPAPVRILCAPHGGGKTTALLQYAALDESVGFISLPPCASKDQVSASFARLRDVRSVVIDQADAASPAGLDALFEHIEATRNDGRSYLLSGASRTRMRAQAVLARGIAVLIDSSALAFDSREIWQLAAAMGVAGDELAVEQLRYDTDGWPVAVAWIVREAARNGRALRGAFDQWRALNGHLLLEFVTSSQVDDTASEAFVAAVRSPAGPRMQRCLERLEADGYPIVRMRESMRPYRVLTQIVGDVPAATPGESADERLILKLFGRFSCRVANHPVAFDRRRDQNVLTYIALAPGATVTRAELRTTFWPNVSQAVASQGLRTTLCRLRRAVSDAAGCDAGRYVSVDNSIGLNLNWVSIDARSFRDCVERAQIEDADGNRSAARDSYLEAEGLYDGALLASEAVEPQLLPHATEYDDLLKLIHARSAALASGALHDERAAPR